MLSDDISARAGLMAGSRMSFFSTVRDRYHYPTDFEEGSLYLSFWWYLSLIRNISSFVSGWDCSEQH